MALTEEWKHRLSRWESALWESLYAPIGRLDFSGFTTFDHLTFEQASARPFQPIPVGTRWGAMWEYGWFKTSLTLPDSVNGQRIVARLLPGGESLVWINGQVQTSIGWGHKEFTLTRSARGGETFELLVESYAGHGQPTDGKGVLLPGQVWMPDPGPTQVTVGESTYGVWREDAYQLALDFSTLLQLSRNLDPLSLRAAQIDEALMQSTRIVDLELPEEEMLETVRAGRRLLRPLLECRNGPSVPVLHAFGHAHLDVAWLWPLAETRRKIARTVSNQLALMDEYPNYRFLQSQPELYQMLKDDYPELYQRFKEAVKSGQVIADGGMWLEADTNITGGESLIRQILFGKRFFRDEFGIDSRILWLPDVFGYSGALPQILVGCQMDGFATHKITWTYNGGDPFPYNLFWWQGIDGSAIPAHIFSDYNSQTTPDAIFERWNTRLQKNGVPSMLLCFGWGDGGGGPARDHLEFMRRVEDLEGLPKVINSSPAEFFAEMKQLGLPRERYVGELYFQAHRGTYTTQARTKRLNRRAEIALREAEFWGATAGTMGKHPFTRQELDSAWKCLLLHQFHDILPGSSIHAVYEETEAALSGVIEKANQTALSAARSLAKPGDGVTVFNSLPWPRRALIEHSTGLVEVDLPACGWTTLPQPPSEIKTEHTAKATTNSLENEYLRVELNSRGEICVLLDKSNGRNLLKGPGNQFQMFKDVPDCFDAWDITSMTESVPVELNEAVTLEIINPGPLVAELSLTRKLHQSTLTQVIRLRRSSRRLDFYTQIDWQETHKLLKVAFPTALHSDEALHEIQFGYVRRPTHRSRPFDADRFEVSQHKWSALVETSRGAAILNDCKYGISTEGGTLRLTLLRSPAAPDPSADRGEQVFTYSFYFWNGSLAESGLIEQAYDLNIPPLVLPGAKGEGWLFKLDSPNIVLESVKPAEDGSGDLVLRLYEALHTANRARLSVNLPIQGAWLTDMLEENPAQVDVSEQNLLLDFRPFEIKTLRLRIIT